MLIPLRHLRGIEAGTVDLAFRRWERPQVRVGTRMRTQVGLVEVTSLDRVTLRDVTAEAARRAGTTRAELLEHLRQDLRRPLWRIGLRFAGEDPRVALRASLNGLDEVVARMRRMGPWAIDYLRLIAANPGVRAPDLAAGLGRETQPFKRDVRRLKELGLTESLAVGYRISPRGNAVLGCWTD